MNIGFDIDGVLTDFEIFVATYGSKFLQTTIKNIKVGNIETRDISGMFACSVEEEDRFWEEYLEYYSREYPSRLGMADVMDKLRQKHKIYIITNRSDSKIPQATMQQWVAEWLEKEQFHYDELIFNNGSKLQACLDNKIDIMIEDTPMHISELSQYMPCMCINAHYNSECEGKNIYRCYSAYDLYEKIRKLAKNM